jgi:lysozyme
MKRQIGTKGLQLIEEFEGLRLSPYLCPAGVATIGIGTTVYPDGTKVSLSDPQITSSQALSFLEHDLKYFCESIELFAMKHNLYLGDNKFTALVCFAYNVGTSPIVTRGKLMYDGLIANDSEKIKRAFLAYTKATTIKNGVAKKIELPGLVKRRNAEMNLFFS